MLAEIDRFISWIRRRNPQARTWRDYQYDLKQFAAFTNHQPPETITFHDIDHFVAHQVAKGYSPATINRRLTCIASFYTFLSTDDNSLICPVLNHLIKFARSFHCRKFN
jgi:site-specific recombinase XerD